MRPPQPPMITERIDIDSSMSELMLGEMLYRIDSGASFCHVNRSRPDVRGMPWVTSGTQKWNGERPSFMVRARVRVVEAMELVMLVTDHWPE